MTAFSGRFEYPTEKFAQLSHLYSQFPPHKMLNCVFTDEAPHFRGVLFFSLTGNGDVFALNISANLSADVNPCHRD